MRKPLIIRKKGSSKLYVLFYYFGRRVEKSTGHDDTPENRVRVREWLDRRMEEIQKNTFVFEDHFPTARESEKKYFATREGRTYRPKPNQVLFGDYAGHWLKAIEQKKNPSTVHDYKDALRSRILPFFGGMTFDEINRPVIKQFFDTLTHQRAASKRGKPLSKSRITNIIVPLHKIWREANLDGQWNLSDPFEKLDDWISTSEKTRREVFRFSEWQSLYHYLPQWYQPIAKLMLLTGMIASELAGLKRTDIVDGKIRVRRSIAKNREGFGKTRHRHRNIPITAAIQDCMDILIQRCCGEHLCLMENGRTFDSGAFGKIWAKAQDRSGVQNKTSYCLRHSFVAWTLTIGAPPNYLVGIMGHGSKKMVYENYGDYVDDLFLDAADIAAFFGPDFLGQFSTGGELRSDGASCKSTRSFAAVPHGRAQRKGHDLEQTTPSSRCVQGAGRR